MGEHAMFDYDLTPRYAPTEVMIVSGKRFGMAPVIGAIAHPPMAHPKGCPLIQECCALELQTEFGSRWFGCERAYINSELRMVVIGTPSRDEVRMKWSVCTTV
jgi:hypothetical protein